MGQLDKAKEQLATLEQVCGLKCEQFINLKQAIAKHEVDFGSSKEAAAETKVN